MTPELSRRSAFAFQHPPISELDVAERMALAERIAGARDFDDLDPEDQVLLQASGY